MISSKNECVFISDLSDLILQIIFYAWWASHNVASKRPIARNDSRPALSGPFYLHCGIEETGSPGIICIVCHQIRRHPSEHGTSSAEKHLLATAHITKLYKLTESEVTELMSSMVEETALANLKRQGSRGITIVSCQRKLILNIQVWFIFTQVMDEMLQTGSEGVWIIRISPRHMESLPHVRISFSSHSMERYITSRAMTTI